eukprot:SAG25_NODE_866_length_5015_cov_1.822213_4_plen_79_part_00
MIYFTNLQVDDASAYQVGGCYRFYIRGSAAAAEAQSDEPASAARTAEASFVGRVLSIRATSARHGTVRRPLRPLWWPF